MSTGNGQIGNRQWANGQMAIGNGQIGNRHWTNGNRQWANGNRQYCFFVLILFSIFPDY
jgi:hypothetical protein